MNYLWDDQLNLFQRLNHGPFAYSDGVEVEDRLYGIVASATDRGTFSSELARSITDWASEYHLSRARHCLLRPLAIPRGSKVLELGCGCGAITRYLGEIGADVVAVDGSLARARVAAERCRDLPNVRVFVDDLLRFETDERFDCVLLIGVLEYAAVFSTQENPFAHYLQSVTRFLAPGGRVVVAIENKLGLKYFNGCAEDHLGAPFFGIQDLYGAKTARTFGRVDLTAQLSAAGLPNASFYYPFPDYKLPSVVLSAEALSDPAFSVIDLLARSHARDYTGSPFRSFDEALAFSVLHDNRLLADLSNSFLVVATAEPAAENPSRELATAFSVHRAPEFCTQTRFVRNADGIQVFKEPLTAAPVRPVLVSDEATISHRMDASTYRPGRQLLWRLLKARARSGDLNPVVEALRPWMVFLLRQARIPTSSLADSSSGSSKLAAYMLPGEFLDCTPFNVLETADGLVAIDLEWQSDREVSLGWVVTRGVLHALLSGLPSANHLRSNAEVTKSLARQYGMSVSDAEIESWLEQEERFQNGTSDVPAGPPTIDLTTSGLQSWVGEISRLNQWVIERDGQIANLHQAVAARDQQIIALHREVGDRDAKIIDRDAKIIDLERTLASTRQELEQARAQAATEIDQLQRHLSNARQQLAMVESSLSWKATGIFRKALSPYPGLRRNIKRAFRLVWWTATLQLPQKLRDRRQLPKDRELVASSPLFDAGWYVARYSDVAAAGWDPALHYLLFGASELRNPGPKFDAGWYLNHNTDVKASGVNPLLHYIQKGSAEGRQVEAVREPASDPAKSSLPTTVDYSSWVKLYDTVTADDAAAIRRHIPTLRETPLISVVMPVYDPEPRFLRKAIDSVIAQLYQNWELCIADDASPDPEISAILKEYARDDPRIKVTYRAQRGHISAASNSALELVMGDFVALMDHDDELPPHALYMVAVELNDHPDADIIYSDEDKIDAEGRRHGAYFKTDWNPELFYSQNMISHLGVYRASMVRQVGGFREGFEGSQDYDLALRIVAATTADRIRHIPYVLYHWRLAGGLDTFSTSNLPVAVHAARRAVAEYLSARGEPTEVVGGNLPFYNRVIRSLPDPPPTVSLIVPTRDRVALLRNCINGLLHNTDYPELEIIIVDNGSSEPDTLDYLDSLKKESRVRILRIEAPFNFSTLNNRAAEIARGEILGFINNDIEVIDPGWLKEMVAQVTQPGVGAVGAKLYYRNDTIQHAGVVLGLGGVAGHPHTHHPRSDAGYIGRLQLVHNLSAVTAACMLMPKRIFQEVGGFDEVNLAVAFNDVDLCLRVRQAGYSIVWTPYAELYHLESASRGYDYGNQERAERAALEVAYMRLRWGAAVQDDPFYSPNLSLLTENFDLAFPPRVSKPWRLEVPLASAAERTACK